MDTDRRDLQFTPQEFEQERKKVLGSWPTGKEVCLEEAVEYRRKLPKEKRLATLFEKAESADRILLEPHAGRALIEDHIRVLRAIEDAGGDSLPTAIDGLTRNERYHEAEGGIKESEKLGRSVLSGFPAVNYGVRGCRRVVEAVHRPVVTRASSPTNRLTAEITLAAGFTGFAGAAVTAFSAYSGKTALSQIIKNYNYVNKLVAFYDQHGVPTVRKLIAYNIGGGGWPPCINVVWCILDALFAAEQGVNHMQVYNHFQGNMMQYVGGIRVQGRLTKEYLLKFGYKKAKVYTAATAWPGAFPEAEAEAWAIIIMQAVGAVLSGARLHANNKTVEQARGLPSIAATAAQTRACRQVLDVLNGQRYPDSEALQLEMDMIERESRLILDKVLEMGDGDPAVGAIKAFEAGVLDVPFSPNRHILCKVMCARDKSRAVRFLDCGQLPFTREIKEFHRKKLAERAESEGRNMDIQMVIDDVLAGLASEPAPLKY